jgi:hypothetical protein
MAVTDYSTSCGSAPLTFIQMLASLIRGYHDIAGLLHYRLNSLVYADACTELSDFLTCNTSHIEPERQLVENTFALDECGYLAWKVFSNSDNDWTDYSECGEVPKSFIEMLSRCIVTYSGGNKINAVIEADVCTSLETALICPNDIEAERLLASNLFAVDDCDRLLIKMFANTSTMTDYVAGCGIDRQSFYQLLARCIVLYNGHYYLNIASVTGSCLDLHPFWTCANNHIDPEMALVENVFATDSCGNLAIKLFNNSGEERQ